ncbi:MAG: extracellular solute-binding protein [Spirochaetes bacterium]|nr:extracellular solute-binding protein [Spirochaetota bacterium]
MSKKGVLILLTVLLVFLVIFSGCKKSEESKTSEKTVLTWWGWFPTQEDFEVIKKDFEAMYPNIELQATRLDYDGYVSKLKQELASGTGPDIMSMQEGALFTQFKPYLLQLDDKLGSWSNNITEGPMEGAKTRGEGHYYFLPIGMSSVMMVYYNATMFEKAGVAVPTTGQEFIDVVAKLKKAYPDKVIVATGLKDGWWASDTFNILANMVSPGITGKADRGEVKWNSESFVKAMELLQDLVKKDVIPKESVGITEYEDAIGLLSDQKALMHLNGTWNAEDLSAQGPRRGGRPAENDVFGAFVLPNLAGGETIMIGGMDIGLSVNKNSKNIDAAMKMLEYMTVGKGQDYFCGKPMGGLVPVKKGLDIDMSAYTDKASQEGAKAIVKGNDLLVNSREISNPSVKNQMAVVVQNVVNGADVKKELDQLQAIADRE